jgi:hypothetical protein
MMLWKVLALGGHQTGAVILAWAFLLSRSIGLGMMVPEAAYEAPTKQVCEAVRETVELVVDQRVYVSECKESDRTYIGVPIYRSTGRSTG